MRARTTVMTKMKLSTVVVCCLLLASSPHIGQAATIYKKIDANGNVVFTDIPPRAEETAETIDLNSPNSFTPNDAELVDPAMLTADTDATEEAAAADYEYSALYVTSPTDDATLRDNAGNVTVTAQVEPGLAANHALRLVMDGTPVATGNQTGTFPLANVDRGTHQIQVQVVDEEGTVVFAGQPSVFHLMRYSALNPGAANAAGR